MEITILLHTGSVLPHPQFPVAIIEGTLSRFPNRGGLGARGGLREKANVTYLCRGRGMLGVCELSEREMQVGAR